MPLLDNIIESKSIAPPKIIVHGEPGVGKTTLAAQAGALLIDCENGAGAIPGLRRTPFLEDWPTIKSYLIEVARGGDEGCRVLAIDTLDWMIERIIEFTVTTLDTKSGNLLSDTLASSHGGYMKGREVARNVVYREVLPILNAINDRGIALLLLAHTNNEKWPTPEGFERKCAVPSIPKWIRDPFTEWADAVLYVNGDRKVISTCTSTVFAKNRYQFPEDMSLSWSAIADALPRPSTPDTEIPNGDIEPQNV